MKKDGITKNLLSEVEYNNLMKNTNLNEYSFVKDGHGGNGIAHQLDNSIIEYTQANVSVFFRNQKRRLIKEINNSNVIVGCIAWLTDQDILKALAAPGKLVSIVVQKEDFLRPDGDCSNPWAVKLRKMYDAISGGLTRYDITKFTSELSYSGDPSVAAIRCVGNHNRTKNPSHPRMHNKFLVFGRLPTVNSKTGYGENTIIPEKVWTGSMNLSHNSGLSFENAVLIRSGSIAGAYLNEYAQILAFSEPLDWEVDWCSPEWRLGT